MLDSANPSSDKEQIERYLDEAFELRELGKSDEALERIKEVFQMSPSNAEAHNLAGLLREDAGDLSGAIESFSHAIGHDPEFEDAYLNLKDAEQTLAHETRRLHPVSIAKHVTNSLIFGGLFFAVGYLLHLIFIYTIRIENGLRLPNLVHSLVDGPYMVPILLSIFVTIGLFLIGSGFNIKRVWAFALLGGIGCLVGGLIFGGLISSVYYAIFALPTIEGIPLYDSRGPIGYIIASGLFMGIFAGFELRRTAILAPVLLGIVGALCFGSIEYLQGFEIQFQIADWLYSAFGRLRLTTHPDIITAFNTVDDAKEAETIFGLSTGLATGVAGIITGLLLSLLNAHLVGSRASATYGKLEDNRM